MKSSYTLRQRTIAYCMTILLIIHVLFGNVASGIVWAEENKEAKTAAILKVDNDAGVDVNGQVICKDEVTIYYAFDTSYKSDAYTYQYTLEDADTSAKTPMHLAGSSGVLTVRNEDGNGNTVYNLQIEAVDEVGNVIEESKTKASFLLGSHMPDCDLQISNKGISNDAVVVTYSGYRGVEGEVAYRRVEKLNTDGVSLLHEGEITLRESADAFSYELTETYRVADEESRDNVYAVEEGIYRVTFFWKGTDGNVVAGTETSSTFIMDTTAPAVTLTCNDEDSKATDGVSCKLKASDSNYNADGIAIIVRKETSASGVTTERITDTELQNNVEKDVLFTEEGHYTIHAEVKDMANNTTITESVSFVIDRTNPEVLVDAGDEVRGGIYNTKTEPVTLSLKVNDDNLVEHSCKVEVRRGYRPIAVDCEWTGTSQEKTTTLTFDDSFADGVYTVKVSAQDALEQTEEKEFVFTIDNTVLTIENINMTCEDGNPPNVVNKGEQTTYYLKDTAKVSFWVIEKNYRDAEIYVQMQKDGELVHDETIGMNSEREYVERTFEEEGRYSLVASGKDSVGNESDTHKRDFVIDKTAPVLEIIQVVDGVESAVSENQLFSVGDNRVLRFSALEKYHNMDTYQIRIEHRTDLSWFPQVTTLKGSDMTWSNVDGTGEIYFDHSDLFKDEGRYTVTFTGEDLAGNPATSKQVSFYIDATAPTIVQTSVIKNGFYYDGAVCFEYDIYEFNYSDATASVTISRTFDGVTQTTTNNLTLNDWNTSFEYWCRDEGAYTITVVARDWAGNEATQSADSAQEGYTVNFVVDKSNPILSVSGVANQYSTRNQVEVVFESKDRNHDFEQYWINVTRSDIDGEIESFLLKGNTTSVYDVESGWSTNGSDTVGQNEYTSQRKLSFNKEGIYQITVGGKDCAGNTATEKSIIFTIDRTAPIISNVTYSNSKGFLTEKHQSIYSKEAILLEFAVSDAMVGVNDKKIYVTVGNAAEINETTALYPAHKSLGNRYYVYIPTDLMVEEFTGTITIWAQDLLQNESNVQSSNIVYTIAKPYIQMNCDVDYNKWMSKDVTFQTNVTDDTAGLKQIVYKVNGEIVKKVVFVNQTQTYQYNVTASDSASKVTGYSVIVEATNNCGVTQTVKKQVYIDKEKPKVQLSDIKSGMYYKDNQTFTTNVEDVSYKNTKTVYYVTRTLDGKTTAMSLGTFRSKKYEDHCTRKLLREGRYRIYAITTDGAGNKQKSNTLSFVIDKTAPMLSITGVSDGAMSGRAVTIQMECVESFYTTNEVEIKVKKEIDGKTTASEITGFPKNAKKATMSKTFNEDGTYTVTMNAKDRAGNVAQTKTVTFSVDVTEPVIRINGTDNYQLWGEAANIQFVIEESYYTGNQVTITGTRTDIDGIKHHVELPQMMNNGKISNFHQLFEEDGFYEILVTAQDKAGNKDSKGIHFTIDQTKPEIKNIEQYQGGYYQSFQLAESLDDVFRDLTVISYRMLLNGVEYNGTDVIEAEGKYDLYVEVKDELGHTDIKNIEFIVDHTPPKVIFSGVKDEEMVTDSGIISLALTNADDIITGIRVNGIAYSADIREIAYEEYGAYRIEVDCEDLAGNIVTRELYFVYNNLAMIVVIIIVMSILIIGTCLWLVQRAKKEKRKNRYGKSSSI